MTVAVVAEKPSVARDLAAVLGADRRGQGYAHGAGYVVTWAIGHLVALAEPHQIDPAWRAWRWEQLPMLPARWPLVVLEPTREQFEVVRRILGSPRVGSVVCATDAGREGELIFRLVYEAAGCDKPVRRLWISSLTPDAIRAGFARLEPSARYDRLALAARARSRADWLVGMNLSRAYSLGVGGGDVLSIGRVQTPTLAMLVERERAIRDFVPEDYLEVVATFSPGEGESYKGTYESTPPDPTEEPARDAATPDGARREGTRRGRRGTRLPASGEAAAAVVARARDGQARVESVDTAERRMSPPFLYDLTELQRHAHRLFGFTAQHTLDVAQSLYERHKLLSYPRTDSRHLSTEIAKTLPDVVRAIAPAYEGLVAPGSGASPLGRRFVDDGKVGDHHAILPTAVSAAGGRLSEDERRLYDLVCRRLLEAWHEPHVTGVTTAITAIHVTGAGPLADRYRTVGVQVRQMGWKVLDLRGRARPDDEPALPSSLAAGQLAAVLDVRAVPKKTEPPARYTEATLLTAMETAGRALDDRELSEAMREVGLGTPATRAATIETLLARGYVVRTGKALESTDKGIALVGVVHPAVKSPAMTGEWEAKLRRIERGSGDFDAFIGEIEAYVRDVVAGVPRTAIPAPAATAADATAPPPSASLPTERPPRPGDLRALLASAFGFESFRRHQEAVCSAVAAGHDVLLVMPTGAGKSLCYQLPGLARGGTTLVVSPLIALIEDQVQKLEARGLRADRVHSARDRIAARRACQAYLDGALDFLFIAPERLAVRGFPEMLARRPPALVAVDEAHCISHWGHDFRPEYRMLGKRLPALRPAPVIALTATATPQVQDDIVEQLGIPAARRFVHGFRRDNLAIEMVEMPRDERQDAVAALLSDRSRRPAIVYVPSRKEADALAGALSPALRARPYHAGMRPADRERTQRDFLGARLDAVVATIAFGMGIDKADIRTVVHTALPASIEGYYQEIGRAGRDGAPSRAVLLWSWADLRTHEYFLEKNYPDRAVLEELFERLSARPSERVALLARLDGDEEIVERALEQLWIHGGALVDADDRVSRGGEGWRDGYAAQRAHREEQLARVGRLPAAHGCRMLDLIAHFGDQEDSGAPCGLCDACAPADCAVRRFEAVSGRDRAALLRMRAALSTRDGEPTGRLFREQFEGEIDRRRFERLLGGLVGAGLARIERDSFEKDGKRIEFARAWLTPEGRRGGEGALDTVTLQALAPERSRRAHSTKRKRRGAGPRGRGERPAAKRAPRAQPLHDGPASAAAEALRAWRQQRAKRAKLPAFRIMSDRALAAIAAVRPPDEEALGLVSGVGAAMVRRYGKEIIAVLRANRGRR